MEPRITAVVLARDRTTELAELIEALQNQTRQPDATLIVNNDGTLAVAALIESACGADPRLEELQLDHNHGGAGGFNAGMLAGAKGGADYVWIFDDDAIPAADCLQRLLACLPQTALGAIGGASRDPQGELAWPLNVEGHARPARTLSELRQFAGGRPAVVVSELAWHALLIPTPVIDRLGGARADLFMWYEDVEYGMRLRRAGLKLYVVPAAEVTHPAPPRTVSIRMPRVTVDVPVTTPPKTYLMIRNSLVVRASYAGWRFWIADLPLTLLRGAVACFLLPGRTSTLLRRVFVRAVFDAGRKRLGPPPAELFDLEA